MAHLALDIPTPTIAEAMKKLLPTPEQGTSTYMLELACLELEKQFSSIEACSFENETLATIERLIKEQWIVIVCFKEPTSGEGHFAIVREVNKVELVVADPELGFNHRIKREDFDWRTGFEDPVRQGWYAAVRRK